MPRLLGLVAFLLLAPLAHAAPPAPLVVGAAPLGDAGAVVAWVPGGAADAFAVYGVAESGAATLLAIVAGDAHFTVVTGSFSTFGVAAIVGGAESARQDTSGCAGVDLGATPPNAYVSTACLPPMGVPVPIPGKVVIDL